MPELPRGTVTLLFTDIEGSTRLLQELGEERFNEALREHRRSVRQAFAAHAGVELRTEGDSFFAAFASAREAAAAAVQAQQELALGPLRVRIGLHTGEPLPVEHEDGYVGVDVHRAARICAAGHGGQVLLSQATRDLLEESIEPRDLGEHRLKDLPEPIRLFQLGEGEFPPLSSLSTSDLPAPPTPLVGRERELAEVLVLVRSARLVTLTGTGGSGKTRLALHAAGELEYEFRDGVFWVSLAALTDPELVLPTIATIVGAKDDLAQFIDEKQQLLLLDNLEQILDCAPALAALLSACPNLRFLVTSRAPLRISGEQEYEVPPLPEPEAIQLFTQRARQLDHGFEPDEHVAEICRRLDGLPLALELAAARLKLLSTGEIQERLGHSLDLLTTGGRDLPERQRTLRATIEWSYELLSEEEQRLFACLSVFAGGCTLGAAEAVCEAELDCLQSLVDNGLLRRTADRYWMLETIREYALGLSPEGGAVDTAHDRHASYFVELVAHADFESRTGDPSSWFERLDADAANLRAALDWTRDSGKPDVMLRLATGLSGYWCARGQISEGIRRLEQALVAAPEPPARALLGLCLLRHLASWDVQEVLEDARGALHACEQDGDDFSLAQAWNLIGRLEASGLGNVSAGERCWERALAHADQGNYRSEKAESMGWLMIMAIFGPLPTDQGIKRCETFFENAGGDLKVQAFAQAERAVLEAMRGEFDLARRLLAAGTRTFETLGLNVWAANNAQEGFYVEMLAGNPRGAATMLQNSYDVLEEMGERGFLSTIAGYLAHALYARGNDDEAERFSRHSEGAAAEDDVFSQVLWRTARAKVYARRGELEEADQLAREAVELAEPTELLNLQADALRDLGEVLQRANRPEEALALIEAAARKYEQKANLVSARDARHRCGVLEGAAVGR